MATAVAAYLAACLTAGAPTAAAAPAPEPPPPAKGAGGAAAAPKAARALARARVCRAALDYPCAERELAAARAGLAALAADGQREVLALSAEVALAQGKVTAADGHLDALLAVAPTFAPSRDAWPPAWRARLEAARRRAPDRAPPALTVHLPVAARPGEPLPVSVVAEDPSGVAGVSVWLATTPGPLSGSTGRAGDAPDHANGPHEPPGGGAEHKLATTDGVTWRGTLPGVEVRGRALRVWVTAWDLRGNGPARWGSPEAPKVLPLAAPPGALATSPGAPGDRPESTPLVERWWFWAAIGAGVAATAAGTYLLVRPDGASQGGTANVGVELAWPAL